MKNSPDISPVATGHATSHPLDLKGKKQHPPAMNPCPLPSFVRILGTLVSALLCLTLSVHPGWGSLEKEIQKKNKEAAAQKKTILALTKKERELHKGLAGLEKSLQEASTELKKLEDELFTLQEVQQTGQRQLDAVSAEHDAATARLAELLQTLWPIYLAARDSAVAPQDSWAEANRKKKWLSALYRQAHALRGDIEQKKHAVAQAQADLDKAVRDINTQQEKIRSAQTSLHQRTTAFESQIKKVRAQRAQSEKALQGLMNSLATLQHKISLQSSKKISTLQGRLPWPVKGKIVTKFAPNSADPSNGIGLALDDAVPVRSISWGKIVHNDQLRGFGRVVIIFHGENYYSLYAFLSDAPLPVGREVKQGEQIGVSGHYPKAGGHGLYFELRFRQKAVNPLKWLQSG